MIYIYFIKAFQFYFAIKNKIKCKNKIKILYVHKYLKLHF
jgi:hypothetical protein